MALHPVHPRHQNGPLWYTCRHRSSLDAVSGKSPDRAPLVHWYTFATPNTFPYRIAQPQTVAFFARHSCFPVPLYQADESVCNYLRYRDIFLVHFINQSVPRCTKQRISSTKPHNILFFVWTIRYNSTTHEATTSNKVKNNRSNFTGPELPIQQLILKRRTALGYSIRELNRLVNDILPDSHRIPLSTMWEWFNRENKHTRPIAEQTAKAIAATLKVPYKEFAEAWDLSRLHLTENKIPEPQAQKSGLEILIEMLQNDKRQVIKKETILNIALRLHKSS